MRSDLPTRVGCLDSLHVLGGIADCLLVPSAWVAYARWGHSCLATRAECLDSLHAPGAPPPAYSYRVLGKPTRAGGISRLPTNWYLVTKPSTAPMVVALEQRPPGAVRTGQQPRTCCWQHHRRCATVEAVPPGCPWYRCGNQPRHTSPGDPLYHRRLWQPAGWQRERSDQVSVIRFQCGAT